MLTLSHIFSGLISSKFLSDLYGLIRRILFLICIRPYCNFTLTLVKHRVITHGTLNGVYYLYAALLLRMTFIFFFLIIIFDFVSRGQLFYHFRGLYINSFTLAFSDVKIPNPPYISLVQLYHIQISIGLDYNI